MPDLPAWDRPADLDLGHDHLGYFWSWGDDESLSGLFIRHWPKDPAKCMTSGGDIDGVCFGNISWAGPATDRARWELRSLAPLHVEPSVLCHCGDHGFIRGGLWVPA